MFSYHFFFRPIVRFTGAFNLYGLAAYSICLICVSLGIVLAHAISKLIGADYAKKGLARSALGPAREATAPSFVILYRKYIWVQLMLVLEVRAAARCSPI